MSDREVISWLHRRVGFGLAPGELDALESLGTPAVVDRLLDGDGAGVPPNPDPWASVSLSVGSDDQQARLERQASITAWIAAMVDTPRPLEEWMRWFWHGHLVSSLADVGNAALMAGQLRLYGQLGLGNFRELLRATTVDPAMLIYLNGAGSHRRAPNENYARELLELFALGLGHYTEDDVKAGAAALTGYRIDRPSRKTTFVPERHDGLGRRFLGVDDVRDVDSVIDAVVAHEACAVWIARSLAEAILGNGVDEGLIDDLARSFRADGLEIRPLVRRILEAGIDGGSRPKIASPVTWMISCLRATQAPWRAGRRGVNGALAGAGQLPLYPPNVSGWPGDEAWLSSSATVSRFNGASVVAAATPTTSPPLEHAGAGDLVALADSLGHPEGFGAATTAALTGLAGVVEQRPGEAVLTVAMASPELIQA